MTAPTSLLREDPDGISILAEFYFGVPPVELSVGKMREIMIRGHTGRPAWYTAQ